MNIQQQTVQALQIWIEENTHRSLRIEDVAEKAGYSKWYIQRIFRHVTHQTLGRYIRERRMHHAAEELITTNQMILTIALKYGYESQQSFTRTFTHYFTVPPAQWRNKQYKKMMRHGVSFTPEALTHFDLRR